MNTIASLSSSLLSFSGEKILGSSVVAPPLHHSVDDPDFVERRTPEVYPVDGGLRKRNNAVEVDHLEDPDEDEEEDEDDSSFTLAEEEQRGWINDLQNRGCRVVQVTYPRTANNEKELSCVRGEFLEVIDDSRNWWKTRNSRGEIGYVPNTIYIGGLFPLLKVWNGSNEKKTTINENEN